MTAATVAWPPPPSLPVRWSATSAVGNGIATMPISRNRFSTSVVRLTLVTWASIVWWFSHMMPIVRKLTT